MVARSRFRVLLLVSATALLALWGCGGPGEGPPGPQESRPEESASSPQAGNSPFTGRPATPAPVLGVKIDNVGPARPHTGLEEADVVYVEEVESGVTRILAVFSSQLPEVVGPVRSARESDIELLAQFDRPALAYSGAQSRLLPLLERAPFLSLPPEAAPEAYFREGSRAAPHNLYLRPRRLLAAASGVGRADDIGFRFGAAPAGGEPTRRRTARFPSAAFAFTWSATEQAWRVEMDGKPARNARNAPIAVPTVVLQRVTVRPSEFHDRWGSVSPYTETVGSGTAVVLRDGQAHDARWRRDAEREGTTFTTPSGAPMPFARGAVWVLYVAA